MEINESIFLQLLKEFEDEIIANHNDGEFDKFERSGKNCEEIKNYINQIIKEIVSLKV